MRLPALRAVNVSMVAALLCVPFVAGPGAAAVTAGGSSPEQGGGSAVASRTLVAVAPPTAWIARLPTWTLSNDVKVRWGATPGGAAVDVYDVRVRRARWNLPFEPLRVVFVDGQATSWTFRIYRGYTYCYSARAQDVEGRVSAWTSETCTTMPLDDRSLMNRDAWTEGSGSAWYSGTYLLSSRYHNRLLLTRVATRRIALIATTCPTCGSVKVYLGTLQEGGAHPDPAKLLKTIDLYSPTTVEQKLIGVAAFPTTRTGTLWIEISSSGKDVFIDGLAVRRN
jgi:hypothetical protein